MRRRCEEGERGRGQGEEKKIRTKLGEEKRRKSGTRSKEKKIRRRG